MLITLWLLLLTGCGGGGGGGNESGSYLDIWRSAEQQCDTLPLKENGAKVDPQEVLHVLQIYANIPYRIEPEGPEHLETACEVQSRGWADCEGQAAYGYRSLREYNKWSDWDIWLVQVLVTRNGKSWRHVFLKVGNYAFDPNNKGPWKMWDYKYFVSSVTVEEIYNQWG